MSDDLIHTVSNSVDENSNTQVENTEPTIGELALSGADILPNSLLREQKNVVMRGSEEWLQLYCANCGKANGGIVRKTELPKEFAWYMCEPCASKWQPLAGYGIAPDELFWEKVKQAQLEAYGRELSEVEVVEALKDDNSMISKLARDRYQTKKI